MTGIAKTLTLLSTAGALLVGVMAPASAHTAHAAKKHHKVVHHAARKHHRHHPKAHHMTAKKKS